VPTWLAADPAWARIGCKARGARLVPVRGPGLAGWSALSGLAATDAAQSEKTHAENRKRSRLGNGRGGYL